ncbi:N-acetylmuramoyl-L-alanine amidase [Neotabrizicola sp. sgz301269]|uniref:N-acetylmuramoyl-L-alanine amidase n=1 Tax=Neotabrizicola sp. sgz301269 TaxID=3276282 RepID=UPI00376FCEC9
MQRASPNSHLIAQAQRPGRVQAFIALLLAVFLSLPGAAGAEELSAMARLDAKASAITAQGETGQDVVVALAISQPVPWRVRLLDNPPRLILDVREVDWSPIAQVSQSAPQIAGLRAGIFRAGWSRLVLELKTPMLVQTAAMETAKGQGGDSAVIRIGLVPATPDDFADAAALPEPPDWSLPQAVALPDPLPGRKDGPVVVVLDPGHGGIDPGAERDGQKEADLMLGFARELKELLLRDGRFQVVMTREEDIFVPLETRISIARAAGAEVFLSLHADAIAEGEAQGATIYTLSDEATDAASAALAERHDRDDLLAGVDLRDQDDLVASVLMDMARTETEPRTARLAAALETAIKAAGLKMHRHPHQEAGFSVLKSPDIPSALLELGFLSSARDLKRLEDKDWRAGMAEALRQALIAWSDEDRALRALRDK